MTADERRLDQLADAHGPRVLGYLARRTETVDDAADIFQAVLITAWQRLNDIPIDDQAALVWLIATARRSLANDRRGKSRRLAATERLRATIRVLPDSPGDQRLGIGRSLERLAEADREILTLVYWEALSVEQAASVLTITAAAARKRLERARSRVRLDLEAANDVCEPA